MSRLSMHRVVFAVFGIGAILVGQAYAASDTGSGEVNILSAVTVTNTQGMDYAGIIAPSVGAQNFVMDAATGVITPGAGDGAAYGTPAAGSFTITGNASQAITSSVVVTTDFSNASLSLGSLALAGDTVTIPGGGSGTITVRGTLNVVSGVVAGSYADAVITLTVDYQ